MKKLRWCACDPNPRQQDGGHKRYHGAMALVVQIGKNQHYLSALNIYIAHQVGPMFLSSYLPTYVIYYIPNSSFFLLQFQCCQSGEIFERLLSSHKSSDDDDNDNDDDDDNDDDNDDDDDDDDDIGNGEQKFDFLNRRRKKHLFDLSKRQERGS